VTNFQLENVTLKKATRLTVSETPGGSSSGSAVSVAAGFCPIAIGTETAGSAVFPASCNGLYGFKLRPGSVPIDGIFTLSESFDGIGVIARTPMDCAALAGVLMDNEDLTTGSSEASSWAGMRIGVVANDWGLYPASKEKWSSQDIVSPGTPACGTSAHSSW
jgi:amidase